MTNDVHQYFGNLLFGPSRRARYNLIWLRKPVTGSQMYRLLRDASWWVQEVANIPISDTASGSAYERSRIKWSNQGCSMLVERFSFTWVNSTSRKYISVEDIKDCKILWAVPTILVGRRGLCRKTKPAFHGIVGAFHDPIVDSILNHVIKYLWKEQMHIG